MPREFSEDTERHRPPEIDETREQQEVDETSKTAEEIASEASEELERREKIEHLAEEAIKELEELDSKAERVEKIARESVKELEGMEEDLGHDLEKVREELHEEFVNDMESKLEESSLKDTSSESEETSESDESEETSVSGESHIEGSDGMVYVTETAEVSESKAELEIEESVEPVKEETHEVHQTSEEKQEVAEQELPIKIRNSIVRPESLESEEAESEQVETPERKKELTTIEEQSIEETSVDEPKSDHEERRVVKESQEIEETSSIDSREEVREISEEKKDTEKEHLDVSSDSEVVVPEIELPEIDESNESLEPSSEKEREEIAPEQDEILEDELAESLEVEDELELSIEIHEELVQYIEELVEELIEDLESSEEDEVDESRIVVDAMTGKEHIDRSLEPRPYFQEIEEEREQREQERVKEKIAKMFASLSEEEREKFKEDIRSKLKTENDLDELIKRNTSVKASPDYKEKYKDAKKYIRGKRKGAVPRLIRELWKDEVEKVWTKLVGVVYRKKIRKKLEDKLIASRALQDWTQERLDKLLVEHDVLKKNKRFKVRYRNAISWIILMTRLRAGLIQSKPSMKMLKDLSKELMVSITTIRKWLEVQQKPIIIVQLERLLHLRPKPGGYKQPLVRKQTITNEIPLSKFNSFLKVRTSLTSRLSKFVLNLLKDSSEGVWFSELTPEYRHLLDYVIKHKKKLEKKLSSKDNETSFTVINNRLYIYKKEVKQFSWTELLNDELFYIDRKWKRKIIGNTLGKLRLKNLTQLSAVIRGITGYGHGEPIPVGGKNADLQSKAVYLSGTSLGFILRVLDLKFKDIKKHIVRLGRSQGKKWQIRNPKFPEGLKLQKILTRLFAIIASDGHIRKNNFSLIYSEENTDRRLIVREILSELGDVWIVDYHDPNRGDSMQLPTILGRLMHKIGIPLGDKVLQGYGIPSFILNAPLEVQAAYIEELIPEEGAVTYAVYGGLKILWGRTVVLHEERVSKQYATPKQLSKALIQFIKTQGKYEELRKCYRLSAGRLRELKKSTNNDTARLATELDRLARSNPNLLLSDEQKLCRKLGIKTGHHLCYVRFYITSGRVSAHWEAHTSSQKDVERWWKIAPPNDVKKRARLDDYFSSQRDKDEES